jgi:hypothetical protein
MNTSRMGGIVDTTLVEARSQGCLSADWTTDRQPARFKNSRPMRYRTSALRFAQQETLRGYGDTLVSATDAVIENLARKAIKPSLP